ncbi:peroxisomal assembly protein [Lithohypha guttulata]|uniref:peroxisomal assembly protein n=1 Tax=Lithohypha guttulata TaxID=1690604 RepID=UPI002DE0882D|nr:peroxisomal assembly protein [Lithohypha guttulata]
MNDFDIESEHRRKRRRREIVPKPVHARLLFDEQYGSDNTTQDQTFVAISPISPLHTTLEDSTWTIAQVRASHDGEVEDHNANIRLSPTSPVSQAFIRIFAAQDHGRHGSHLPKFFDVKIVPTAPVVLDTVYVSIEKGLIGSVDEIQTRFGGGFQHAKNRKTGQHEQLVNAARNTNTSSQDRVSELIRQGLSALSVIHVGDIFPLPLPPHPITHVRPAPAIVMETEPVSQGLVSQSTKIVVVHAGSSQEKALKKLSAPTAILEESLEDTPEDETATDQFFSAAEDRNTATASELEASEDEESHTDASESGDSDEESDSMDDMISLSAPGLPPQQAGTLSAMTAATPRPGQYGRATGAHTPGSVYSSFTQSTARAGSRPGKVFRTEALLKKMPAELLHPRPSPQEDDDSFVFVDTSTLAKLGCFSGDWARVEVARNVSSFGFGSGLAALNEQEEADFRIVRVFGLSGLLQQKARYAVDKTGTRRSSFTPGHTLTPLSPTIHMSPILLANLSNAQFIKLAAIPKSSKTQRPSYAPRPPSYRGPPMAKEVSLAKVLTPLTQDPSMQSILFTSLKTHFEKRRRLVKIGDVIPVSVDEDLARTTSTPGSTENSMEDEHLLSRLNVTSAADRARLQVAWFVVQSVDADLLSDNSSATREGENWGGTSVLDTSQTKLGVSGTSHHNISDLTKKWSRFWLGLRSPPRSLTVAQGPLITPSSLPESTKLPLEKRLADLVAAATSPRATSLGLPPLVILLHSNQRQVGKTFIAKNACTSVGVHTFTISGHDLLSENASTTGGGDVKTEGLLRVRAERALSCGAEQTAILLQHIDVLTADRMVPTIRDVIESARVVIATTSKLDDVPAGLRSLFTHELEVVAPDEVARESILRSVCSSLAIAISPMVNLKNVALQTAALVAGDLVDVVHRASLARSNRLVSLAEAKGCDVIDLKLSGGLSTSHLMPIDFSTAIAAARSTFSDAIGAPKIPSVTWQDVGGLASQKDAIMETISLPLTHPELFANGVRKRSGILFYGPPGTGKTLLAKAIATEFSLNFFSVKGPELLNMYIGESEANVRRVFQKARDARPCVVFFDELDSVAPKRGNQGDSGGVMDRIVSQLLAELDGMSGGGSDEDGQTSNAGGVFVIGATNRPDLLDPALLRPGRFDKMLYLGVADSHDAQSTILEALTRKFTMARDVDLQRIAQKLPFTYTGADLYALCSDAMLKAITRKTKGVDDRVEAISQERGEPVSTGWFFDHAAKPEDVEVIVNEEDFELAQKELVGSVSAKELEHFERIRQLFEDQDISAGTSNAKGQPNGASEGVNRQLPRTNTAVPYTDKASSNKGSLAKQKSSKGKGVATDGSEADQSENDYGFPTYNSAHLNGSLGTGLVNGTGKGKSKVLANDFQEDIQGDEEDLYS